VIVYFFFAVFFAAGFFAVFFAAGFLAAIMLTTFHAVRDLPVALLGITCRIAPANLRTFSSGDAGDTVKRRGLMTCDSTELLIQ
jgi:cytochrome c biogenesis protein CcdA